MSTPHHHSSGPRHPSDASTIRLMTTPNSRHRSGHRNYNHNQHSNNRRGPQLLLTPPSRLPANPFPFPSSPSSTGSSSRPRRPSIGNVPILTPSRMPYSVKIEITKEMEEEIRQMNIRYLKSQDKEFRYLVEKSSQAAIYRHQSWKGWADPEAAGCLMLYERNTSPRVAFIILNRFAVPHWNHCFTPKSLEVQVQGSYLLFKDGPQIFTLWFYKHGEAEKFCDILQRWGSKVIETDESQQIANAAILAPNPKGRNRK